MVLVLNLPLLVRTISLLVLVTGKAGLELEDGRPALTGVAVPLGLEDRRSKALGVVTTMTFPGDVVVRGLFSASSLLRLLGILLLLLGQLGSKHDANERVGAVILAVHVCLRARVCRRHCEFDGVEVRANRCNMR